jgi:hypothetical protein
LALKGGFYGILMIQEHGCTKHKTFTNTSSNCETSGLNKSSHKINIWNGTALDSKYSYHKKEKHSANCLMTSHTFALAISYK